MLDIVWVDGEVLRGEGEELLLNGARAAWLWRDRGSEKEKQSSKGAFEHGVPHLSPSSSAELLFSIPWGYSSHTGFPLPGKRESS